MSQSDFVSRGQALITAGQYQEAVKVCRLGLLGRPTTVEGRVVLGQALLALKRYDEVLAEMRVALELDHASVAALVLKGEALLRKGDAHSALDVLQRAKLQMPSEPRIGQLLAEAKRAAGRPNTTAGHPAVGFLDDHSENTRHYPNHGADEEDTSDDSNDESLQYTRPTSLSAPNAKKRTPRPAAVLPDARLPDATPPPAVLAVGDRSGTVEVDPELDGVELSGEEDFAEVAAPPRPRGNAQLPPPGGARGQVVPSTRGGPATVAGRAPAPGFPDPLPRRPQRGKPSVEISTLELDDDEIELEPVAAGAGPVAAGAGPVAAGAGPVSMVRQAVNLAPGPFARPAGLRQTNHQAAVPPPQPTPHAMQAPALHNPYAGRPNPIAAAMPTVALQPAEAPPPTPLPQPDPIALPLHLQHPPAVRPTVAAPAMPLPAPDTPDPFAQANAPAWARATVAAVPNGAPPPHVAAPDAMPASVAQMLEPSQASSKSIKTGIGRKARSRLAIVVWILIGALVIGGGVFAGFQIRNMRLQKQITEAREQAMTLAKTDTWKGWIGARDRLAGIAQAAGTLDNVAALAQARALVAYEFGEGLPEAKAAYDAVARESTLDVELAGAYLGLAQNDPPAARAAAERAQKLAPDDPSALYVGGQAALLVGETATARQQLEAAVAKEPRPIHAIALARVLADGSSYTEALAAIDKALAASPDHPGALIERANLLTTSGQIGPRVNEVRATLQRIIAEGGKPVAEQPRGVSPAQVAFTQLALARVEFMRGDVNAVNAALKSALAVNFDDQRFGEAVVETLYAVGELDRARAAAERALKDWSQSRRIRIALARTLIAQGKPDDALAALGELKDFPRALAVRGQAQLASDDLDAARASFEAALKKQPTLEMAVVGRAWVDLANGDADAAQRRVEKLAKAPNATTAVATVYAAALRTDKDPASKEQAKAVLEKAVNGPPSLELARAQLELARIVRDLGDYSRAKSLYADASRLGNREARLEHGMLLVDTGDITGGRDTLVKLLEVTEKPSAMQLLQTARAQTLAGEHAAATELLARADQAPNVVRWIYQRERGRLELRKGHYSGAAAALTIALEGCGTDPETFTLAADTGAAEAEQAKFGEKVKAIAEKRLADKPELHIVTGKLSSMSGAGIEETAKAFETARDMLKKLNAPARRQAQAELGRAIVSYNKKEDRSAIDALTYVISLDPSLYEAYLYLADIYKEAKDPKTAMGHAKNAIKFNPDLIEGYEMIGTLAARIGDRKQLDEAIRKLNEIAPNSERLKELARMQR